MELGLFASLAIYFGCGIALAILVGLIVHFYRNPCCCKCNSEKYACSQCGHVHEKENVCGHKTLGKSYHETRDRQIPIEEEYDDPTQVIVFAGQIDGVQIEGIAHPEKKKHIIGYRTVQERVLRHEEFYCSCRASPCDCCCRCCRRGSEYSSLV